MPGFEGAALGFGGAAGTRDKDGGGETLFCSEGAGAFDFCGGGQVGEVSWNEFGADASVEEFFDFDSADEEFLVEAEFIAGADLAGRFDGVAVAPGDAAEAAGFGGLGARFEEPDGPQPDVEAHGGRGWGLAGGSGGSGLGVTGHIGEVGGNERKPKREFLRDEEITGMARRFHRDIVAHRLDCPKKRLSCGFANLSRHP